MKKTKNVLSVEFLYELFACALENEFVCTAVTQHVTKSMLPDRSFQALHDAIGEYYGKYNGLPSNAYLYQKFAGDNDTKELLEVIGEDYGGGNADAMLDMLEDYIKAVVLKEVYSEVGKLYNSNDQDKAQSKLAEYANWVSSFSLKPDQFIDVIDTFESRFKKNRDKHNQEKESKTIPVTRFYIDPIDECNGGRDLRGQLTCFLASTGVGKSHIARHVGSKACTIDGLNVLHFQLEGSESEVLNAYSGSLIEKNSFLYEKGVISDTEMSALAKELKRHSGSISVRTFPRFNNRVTTIDIQNGIKEYKKKNGFQPDIVIIDSMDLLHSCNSRRNDDRPERFKRTEVANDLKDLASDENVWVIVTYQATIENRDWLNDEKNVLTEYNCSEAKGLARPLTHLITLNRSSAEESDQTMRLHIAKSRFFARGKTFKIATDYDNEVFFDKQRTLGFANND